MKGASMKKGLFFCVLLVALGAMFTVGPTAGQPRPYGSSGHRSSDTISTTIAKGVAIDGHDAWFAFFFLNDDASGTGYLTTYTAGSANETCAVHIRPGYGWAVYAPIDSFRFTKADSSDCFTWDVYR